MKRQTIVQVNDKYRLAADVYQWAIQEKQSFDNRRDKEVWRGVAYFPTLHGAAQELAQRMIRLSGACGARELLAEIEKASQVITCRLAPLLDAEVRVLRVRK